MEVRCAMGLLVGSGTERFASGETIPHSCRVRNHHHRSHLPGKSRREFRKLASKGDVEGSLYGFFCFCSMNRVFLDETSRPMDCIFFEVLGQESHLE